MFNRVLIANRGEVAVRVIRTLHELGIEAVVVYSTADEGALHTRLADRAVCVGPPVATESYLKIPSIIAAATTTRCDAVHPGWGFLAENPAFAAACDDNELVFIGPSAETMARMGDKVDAKREMIAAGVPVVPGTEEPTSIGDAGAAAEETGYPVLLKAVAGGGGKGMRFVEHPEDLERAYQMAAAEAEAAFGDPGIYIEKAVVPARHVEIQVLADGQGGVLTLGERDCSIQRRHQKLIEESPSPALTPEIREEMEAAAERACHAIGYRSAGTFEFLLGPDGSFFFIELNARLQVEHPVTEMITGVDLVREQLRVAAGESLSRTGRAERRGHAIEVRINAEDPSRGFLPMPGRIERFKPPLGPGVRVDTHIEDGAEVPPYYDSLLGKVIAWDENRDVCDRTRAEGSRGDGSPGRADDDSRGHRHLAQRAVRDRPLLDQLPGRGGLATTGAGGELMSGRRAARRTALFLLYQWDLTRQPLASLYEGEVDPFARELAEAVIEEAEELDREITESADDWSADRLGALERNILRIGVHELANDDVPVEVAINEAVELTKRYASDDAARLVNGILGRIAREKAV